MKMILPSASVCLIQPDVSGLGNITPHQGKYLERYEKVTVLAVARRAWFDMIYDKVVKIILNSEEIKQQQ